MTTERTPTVDAKPATGPFRQGGPLSAVFFTELAVICLVLFAVVHLAGGRHYASILSGTVPTAHVMQSVYFGALYVTMYFLAVIAAPILLISAALMYAIRRIMQRRAVLPSAEAN